MGGDGETRLAAKDRRRLVHWHKGLGDSAAADATSERVVWKSIDACTLVNVLIEVGADLLTANDTNYADLVLTRWDAGGTGNVNVGSRSTKIVGGTGNWNAFRNEAFLALSNTAFANGQKLTLKIDKVGTGVIVPPFALVVEHTVD